MVLEITELCAEDSSLPGEEGVISVQWSWSGKSKTGFCLHWDLKDEQGTYEKGEAFLGRGSCMSKDL